MIRTQIQLRPEDFARLRREASRQGRPMAECIREGIDLFLRKAEGAREDLKDLPTFHADVPDDLKPHDRWWAEVDDGRDGGR